MQQLAIDEKYDCHWLIFVHVKIGATTKQQFGYYACVQQILCGKQCMFNQQQGKTKLQRAINETGWAHSARAPGTTTTNTTMSHLTQWQFEDSVNF